MKLLAFFVLIFASAACSDSDGDSTEKSPVECGKLTESECLAEAECLAVYGRKIDEAAMCYAAETEMMACAVLAVAECPNNAVGYASGPDGTCWFQPSVCSNIGDGYTTNPPAGTGTCPEVNQICP